MSSRNMSGHEVSEGEEFRARLRDLIGYERQSAFATRVGISQTAVSNALSGRSLLDFRSLVRISKACDVSLNWLVLGVGPARVTESDTSVADNGGVRGAVSPPPSSHSPAAEVPIMPRDVVPAPGTDLIWVPRLDVQASAGAGAIVDAPEVAFSGAWLARRGLGKNLAMIEAHGDSMEPSIRSSDDLIVDMDITDTRKTGIYVLRRDDFLFVKRLVPQLDGSLSVKSDNPMYREEVVSGRALRDLHVIGRVVRIIRDT